MRNAKRWLLRDFLLQGKVLVKDFGTEGRSERGELRLHKMFSNDKSQAKGGKFLLSLQTKVLHIPEQFSN